MAEEVVKLTRPELYERVWTTAVSRVAPELGISDVGLRKICQRFDIPLPPLGYWAKKQQGEAEFCGHHRDIHRYKRIPSGRLQEPEKMAAN